jgi:hypothetical protein
MRIAGVLGAAVVVGILVGCGPRGETRLRIDWSQQPLASGSRLVSCGSDCSALHVELAAAPTPINLLTLESPPIDGKRWAIEGRVRYERVASPGYLELWNFFGDGSRYFSRTLAESGPMARLDGDSDWRMVLLPFDATQATAPLVQLELNAVLPGGGVVELQPLRLIQY